MGTELPVPYPNLSWAFTITLFMTCLTCGTDLPSFLNCQNKYDPTIRTGNKLLRLNLTPEKQCWFRIIVKVRIAPELAIKNPQDISQTQTWCWDQQTEIHSYTAFCESIDYRQEVKKKKAKYILLKKCGIINNPFQLPYKTKKRSH